MVESVTEKILRGINEAVGLYHRLVLIVAPSGSGKTAALQNVQTRLNAKIINLNLELSRRMLELTERQRTLQLPKLMNEISNVFEGEIVLLDNLEVLFDVALKQDPLRLLQGLARHKTIVAAWNGSVNTENLTYATPVHSEFKRYSLHDLLIVNAAVNA